MRSLVVRSRTIGLGLRALLALASVSAVFAVRQLGSVVPRKTGRQSEACEAYWRELGRDPPASRPVLIDFPQVAQWRDRLVALGDPAVEWRDALSDTQPRATTTVLTPWDTIGGATWDADGTQRILPRFANHVAMYPRPAATSDGILHVVYGTRIDLTGRTWTTTPDTLWHVAYDGRAWTRPEPLPSSPSGPYWWDNISPSALVASGTTLDIAVPTQSRDSTTIELLHRDSSGQWVRRPVVTGGLLAIYVRLARLRSELLLTWAGPDPNVKRRDRSSVFAARSLDEGRTWISSQRLHLSGLGATYDHALLVDSTGQAFVLWRQHSPSANRPSDTVGVAATSDSGRTWRELAPLSLLDGFGGFGAALSRWGPIAVFRRMGSDGMDAAILRDRMWVLPHIASKPATGGLIQAVTWPANAITVLGGFEGPPSTRSETTNRSRPASKPVTLTVRCANPREPFSHAHYSDVR